MFGLGAATGLTTLQQVEGLAVGGLVVATAVGAVALGWVVLGCAAVGMVVAGGLTYLVLKSIGPSRPPATILHAVMAATLLGGLAGAGVAALFAGNVAVAGVGASTAAETNAEIVGAHVGSAITGAFVGAWTPVAVALGTSPAPDVWEQPARAPASRPVIGGSLESPPEAEPAAPSEPAKAPARPPAKPVLGALGDAIEAEARATNAFLEKELSLKIPPEKANESLAPAAPPAPAAPQPAERGFAEVIGAGLEHE